MDFPGIHSLLLSISCFQSRYSVITPTVLPHFLCCQVTTPLRAHPVRHTLQSEAGAELSQRYPARAPCHRASPAWHPSKL